MSVETGVKLRDAGLQRRPAARSAGGASQCSCPEVCGNICAAACGYETDVICAFTAGVTGAWAAGILC